MYKEINTSKRYEKVNIKETPSIFDGTLNSEYQVDISILKRLSKDLGFSYDMYLALREIDEQSAYTIVKSMSEKSKHEEIYLLLDDKNHEVLDYSLDSDRAPLLNNDFIHRLSTIVSANEDVSLSEIYYHEEDKVASAIIYRKEPIVIEEKYIDKESKFIDYNIGIIVFNDESSTSYSRLVLYVEDQPLYLPASYYSATASRYKRSTSSSAEALEVLTLKAIDDLRSDSILSKISELHYIYRTNKNILASYEEYATVLRTMKKVPTIIDDNSFLESLDSKYEEFEKKYAHLEDKRSSYIWRCTALSDITVGLLVSITSKILTELHAPAIEYNQIRELLGAYISTSRIAEEIAQEDLNRFI